MYVADADADTDTDTDNKDFSLDFKVDAAKHRLADGSLPDGFRPTAVAFKSNCSCERCASRIQAASRGGRWSHAAFRAT